MHRRLAIILIGIVVILAGVVITVDVARWLRVSPKPAAETAASKPAVRELPKAAPVPSPAPDTALEPDRRPARRSPAPAPPPVEAAPETGALHIESDVPGAQVFIDREFIGTTPLTAQRVTPGTHRLNVSVPDYEGIADTIDVSPGPRDIMIRFKEVRLNAKIDVVHTHRIGSCKGSLVATAQGLRYETSDKDDAFTAGLLDLESFDVNYLEKRLTVKSRKGKRFDFTDPAGNADHLFVFHRDVEKARERLKKGDRPAAD